MYNDIINQGILSTIGHTPLVKLIRIFDNNHLNLYAKLEFCNPGGSMKDRPALNMIQSAMEKGEIRKGTTIIESSSGNMAIGLALACRYYDLRFICVVDPKVSTQNLRILETYGAEIEYVSEPDAESSNYLQARLNRVEELLGRIENSYWPCQYRNFNNPKAHYKSTIREIVSELASIDYIFCAVSTLGTIKGCVEYIVDHNINTKVIAVDAINSNIFEARDGKRLLPGHGSSIKPFFYEDKLAANIYDYILVTDMDCVIGCHRLVRREAILAGGSSGGIISGIDRIKDRLPLNATCVLILPDRGDRYLNTIYSKSWVKKHLSDIDDRLFMHKAIL